MFHFFFFAPSPKQSNISFSVDDNGPFYTQLGFASTFADLKQVFVERLGAKEGEVRLIRILIFQFWFNKYSGENGESEVCCTRRSH